MPALWVLGFVRSNIFLFCCCVRILIYIFYIEGEILKMNQGLFKHLNHWFWLLLLCCFSFFKECFGGLNYILTNHSSWNSTSPSRKMLLLGCMDAKAYRPHTHRLVTQIHTCACAYMLFYLYSSSKSQGVYTV